MKRAAACTLIAATFAAGLAAAPAAARDFELVHGVPLYPWSKQVAENRYRSPANWDATLKHFRKRFKGLDWVTFEKIANLPEVQAEHIASSNPRTAWEGINVYRVGQEVRYFILPRRKAGETEKKEAPAGTGKRPAGKKNK